VRPAEVTDALGAEGAIEVALKAKQEGKIKFIGFSAHTTKGALQALKSVQVRHSDVPELTSWSITCGISARRCWRWRTSRGLG